MKFVEAFNALGYEVENPRQDWSAERDEGVCISLWRREMGTRNGLLWMNTRVHADPIENWGRKLVIKSASSTYVEHWKASAAL